MADFFADINDNLAVICTTHIKLSLTRVNNRSFVTVLFLFFEKIIFVPSFLIIKSYL